MSGKQLLGAFRSARWATPAEAERGVAELEPIDPGEVLTLLDGLAAGPPDPDLTLHRMRCLGFVRLVEKTGDRSLFLPLVRALKTPDPELRRSLVEALPRVNNVTEHPALCALLRSADVGVRAAAAQALSEVGGKTVFDLLSEMLGEPGLAGRAEAMQALVAVGEQRAVAPLAGVLETGSVLDKLKAIDLLADPRCAVRAPQAVARAVARGLDDAAEPVVLHALEALSRLSSEDEYLTLAAPALSSAHVNVACAAVAGLRRHGSSRTLAALQSKLREGPRQVRLAVVEALENIGTSAVLKPLVDALGHRQLAVRMRAAEALTRLGREGKLDLARSIVFLLRSLDVNVRRMAVELAQSVPDPAGELWPKLLACLRDEDWWVRERVADALVEMAGEKLVRPIVAYLQDPAHLVRRFAVDVLRRIKAPETLGALVHTAAEDADWWVREGAIEAIAALGDARAVPYLVDLLLRQEDIRIACLQALSELRARDAAPQVASLLELEDADVRTSALRCLGELGDSSQAALVQPLLRDANPALRLLAREILTRWQADAAATEAATALGLSLLDQLLVAVARMDGDDLILMPDRQPMVKRFGRISPLAKNVFSEDTLRKLLIRHLSVRQLVDLESRREVDLSYEVKAEGLRFRVNIFQQLGGISAVFRSIKGALPRLERLGLPPVVGRLADLNNGLVLVGGPTGAGKSTTLAALIDHINASSSRHIITFEDPIEVVHRRKRSLVNQREIGTHTASFSKALRAALREDPDVILIGEMRDFATISFAVTAAETGHLVFGTVHTVSAAMTVDRLINAFPAGQQDQVRSILAGSLRAVVCQYLIRRRKDAGRCLSVEVMLNNDAVSNLIRTGKAYQIPSVISTSRELGMQLMDQELTRLVREGSISAEDAYNKASNKKDFEAMIEAQAGTTG